GRNDGSRSEAEIAMKAIDRTSRFGYVFSGTCTGELPAVTGSNSGARPLRPLEVIAPFATIGKMARRWPSPAHLAGRSCGRFRLGEQGELKGCSRTIIGCCPETAVMSLDNRTADRQPDSHSILFRCIESLKEFVGGFRREAYSHIFHGQAH